MRGGVAVLILFKCYTCLCTVYVCIFVYIHSCVYMYIYIYVYIFIRLCLFIYIHTYIHTKWRTIPIVSFHDNKNKHSADAECNEID